MQEESMQEDFKVVSVMWKTHNQIKAFPQGGILLCTIDYASVHRAVYDSSTLWSCRLPLLGLVLGHACVFWLQFWMDHPVISRGKVFGVGFICFPPHPSSRRLLCSGVHWVFSELPVCRHPKSFLPPDTDYYPSLFVFILSLLYSYFALFSPCFACPSFSNLYSLTTTILFFVRFPFFVLQSYLLMPEKIVLFFIATFVLCCKSWQNNCKQINKQHGGAADVFYAFPPHFPLSSFPPFFTYLPFSDLHFLTSFLNFSFDFCAMVQKW